MVGYYKVKLHKETACLALYNETDKLIDTIFINKFEYEDMTHFEIEQCAMRLAANNKISGYALQLH